MAKTAVPHKRGVGARASGEKDGGTVKRKNGRVQKNGKVQDGRAELARIEQAMRAAAAGDLPVRLPNRRKDG